MSEPSPGLKPEELGQVVQEFRPSVVNLAAGIVLGSGFICGAIAVEFIVIRAAWERRNFQGQGDSWFIFAFISLVMLFFVAAGVFLIWFAWSLRSLRVVLHEKGVYWSDEETHGVFPFHRIAGIVETTTREHLPLLRAPLHLLMPTKTSRSYLLVRVDGEEFEVGVNTVKNSDRFGELLLEAAEKYEIPITRREESD